MRVAFVLFGIIDIILLALAGNIMVSDGHIAGSNAYYAVLVVVFSASVIGFIQGVLLATLPKHHLPEMPEK